MYSRYVSPILTLPLLQSHHDTPESSGAAVAFQTDLDKVRVRTKPPEGWHGDCGFDLQYSMKEHKYIAFLRDDDVVEFRDHNATLRLSWSPVPTNPKTEVRSSGFPVKPEIDSQNETTQHDGNVPEGNAQEDSPPDRPRTPTKQESQISTVKETPSHTHSGRGSSEAIDGQLDNTAEYQGSHQVDQNLPNISDTTLQSDSVLPSVHVEISPRPEEDRTLEAPQSPHSSGKSTLDDQAEQDVVEKESNVLNECPKDHCEPASNKNTKRKLSDTTGDMPARQPRSKRTRISGDEQLISSAPSNSAPSNTPTSTQSRRRLSPRATQASFSEYGDYSGESPLILFPFESGITSRKGLMRFLGSHNAKKTEDVKNANFFCIAKGDIKTTAKLLHSLTTSKHIVTEDWVVRSSKAGRLLAPSSFIPGPLKSNIHLDRSQLFAGHVLYISPKLRADYKKGWDEIYSILQQAGKPEVINTPAKKLKDADKSRVTLFLGLEANDPDAKELQEEHKFYKKDLISASIIAGTVLHDKQEFVLGEVVASVSPPAAKAKKGKK